MELREQLFKLAESYLNDESLFIVDVLISGTTMKKITIMADGDKGINIDKCAEISRKVGHQVEEQNLIENAYVLEVTSPGVDFPLSTPRHYAKNIGRRISILMKDGSNKTGRLEGISDTSLQVSEEIKVKKKININPVEIPINEIKKSNVLVSFK